MKPIVLLLLAMLLLTACTARDHPAQDGSDATRKIDLATDRARASYMVGVDVANDLRPIRDDIDLEIVQQSMRATLSGQKPQLDAKQLDQVRREFTAQLREKRARQAREVAERNRRTGEAFLVANAGKPGVVTTPSGLQYQILRPGSGPHPGASATVSIHYIGRTLEGREFSNTYAAQHPETLPLPRVMPGLAEAMTLMTPGSRYRFWIPGPLAYGEAGRAGDIEPNATLVFDIELLESAGGDRE
ncbi:FKBP-type peptidyl-prolyl cis-trans isomerase [Lysobacter sp. Root494]|uniref:FKBP-type peptidyl-prolyl cis-trans isomerase N-terminal domain-containing protein n=1 Tax=Lysobacter sp. Root494 TaxID=1736549 RepID=UPI0007125F05|nr:FKBP-type peptidyl-prolyl cis-trans isomerase [Lysobacter sp. Root494]KQY55064.1 hypothetical protein ASD14_02570 [Lysobacter sp. Root494]